MQAKHNIVLYGNVPDMVSYTGAVALLNKHDGWDNRKFYVCNIQLDCLYFQTMLKYVEQRNRCQVFS